MFHQKNKTDMKKIIAALLLTVTCLTASAQQNFRSGYFLDGFTYKYKLNPAFGSDRSFLSVPSVGYFSAGVETGLSLASFVYPTADGGLTTFMSPSVSHEQVMKGFSEMNPINANVDMDIFSLGICSDKSFNSIDLSFKTDVRANIPGSLFSWVKETQDMLDMSNLGFNSDARLELAYGHSRKIGENIRVGARFKFLIGMAKAHYTMDKLSLNMTGEKWRVETLGSGYMAAPIGLVTEGADRRITGFDIPEDPNIIIDDLFSSKNYGFAMDLGFSMDLLKYITVSASVIDLGSIKWKSAYKLGSPEDPWEYSGFTGIGSEESVDINEQFSQLGDEILEVIYPRVMDSEVAFKDKLSMTANVGVEVRMPFWERMSVGLLGTTRVDGPYSWTEGRASLNIALLRFFSVTGSFAHSTFGESLGAAVNFHPAGINLFIGMDSFKPFMNMTPQLVPIDSFSTNFCFGLNLSIGRNHDRYARGSSEQ